MLLVHSSSSHLILMSITAIEANRQRHFFAADATLRWGGRRRINTEDIMKKARLQKVADHLRKVRIQVAKENGPEFDMESWGALRERGVFKGKKDLKCMTSACAIGYTAHLFAKQGFKLKIHPDVNNALIPVYKKLSQFGAVAAFFDITFHEANYLFNAKDYPNEDENGSFAAISVGQVADRIENFIHGIKE